MSSRLTVHEIVAQDVAQAYIEGAVVDLLDEPAAVEGRIPESSSTTQAFVAQDAAGGNPMSWSTTQVASWFEKIGCPEYIPLVKKKNLNGQLLVLLEDQELKDFGIKNSFDRKKILLELSNAKRAAEKKRKRDSQSRPGPSVTAKKKKSAMGQKESAGGGGSAVSLAAETKKATLDWDAEEQPYTIPEALVLIFQRHHITSQEQLIYWCHEEGGPRGKIGTLYLRVNEIAPEHYERIAKPNAVIRATLQKYLIGYKRYSLDAATRAGL